MFEAGTNKALLHNTKQEIQNIDGSKTKLSCGSSLNDINDLDAIDNLNASIGNTQMDDLTQTSQNATDDDTNPKDAFIYTNEIRVKNNLLKLLFDMNVPNYAFKKIMDWAHDAYTSGYQFAPRATNYNSQIRQMESFSNLQSTRPYVKQIALQNSLEDPSDTTTLNVVCCDFTSMLFSLLQDKSINKKENLVVNRHNYFAKYVSPNGKLGEVNSGSWYEHAYSTMVKDASKDFLLPIIFAMDKTTTSSTANMSVYPVMFTTTIFDCKTHNKAHAWRPLGYIPIEQNYYSKAQWKKMDKVLKSKRENQLFEIVLQSFRQAQQDGALDNVELKLGNHIKMVNLKVPLAFIIGDIQGGDGICGRTPYYGQKARRIC